MLENYTPASSQDLINRLKSLYKALEEAQDTHCDFLADETVLPAEKDAAENEFDELSLENMRLLNQGDAKVEDIEFDYSEEPTDYSEKDSSDDSENGSVKNVEIPPEKDPLDNARTDAVVLDGLKTNNQDEDRDQNEILGYGTLICESCGYKARTKHHIKMHVKMDHEENLLPCLHCGHRPVENCSLKNHIQTILVN